MELVAGLLPHLACGSTFAVVFGLELGPHELVLEHSSEEHDTTLPAHHEHEGRGWKWS